MHTPAATAVLLALVLEATAATAQPKVIRAARVWDGTRIVNDAQIVIEGDRILRIVELSAPAPANAEVLDLRN